MFDIGFLELLIIGVVGLLVLGPERLPRAARSLGLWIGKIKRSVSSMQREISAQLEAEELRQKLNEQQKKLDESVSLAKRDVERLADPEPPRDAGEASPRRDRDAGEAPAAPERRLDDALARARRDAAPDDDGSKRADSADKDAPAP